jgi:protein SCO1/2
MTNVTRRDLFALPSLLLPGSRLTVSAAERGNNNPPLSPREKLQQRYLPNVELYTHEGKKVRFYDDLIKGKVVTLNFMYATCQGVCPVMTANLVKVQKLLGDRVGRELFMYSITFKPEQDGPEALKNFRDMHGVKPGWTFLTGKPDEIERLRRKLGFVNLDPELDKDPLQHGNLRYGNEPLMLWGAVPGLAAPEFIAKSVLWMIRPKE